MRITFEDTPRLAHVSEDGMRNQSILSHLEGTAVIAERFAKSFGCLLYTSPSPGDER